MKRFLSETSVAYYRRVGYPLLLVYGLRFTFSVRDAIISDPTSPVVVVICCGISRSVHFGRTGCARCRRSERGGIRDSQISSATLSDPYTDPYRSSPPRRVVPDDIFRCVMHLTRYSISVNG